MLRAVKLAVKLCDYISEGVLLRAQNELQKLMLISKYHGDLRFHQCTTARFQSALTGDGHAN
jgi:hypothetical protein